MFTKMKLKMTDLYSILAVASERPSIQTPFLAFPKSDIRYKTMFNDNISVSVRPVL